MAFIFFLIYFKITVFIQFDFCTRLNSRNIHFFTFFALSIYVK